jgi:hypothetical protein
MKYSILITVSLLLGLMSVYNYSLRQNNLILMSELAKEKQAHQELNSTIAAGLCLPKLALSELRNG